MIYVFTDGSSLTPNGVGGWAYSIVEGIENPFCVKLTTQFGEEKAYDAQGYNKTTNNRMEMIGASRGIETTRRLYENNPITLVTDSLLVIKGITEWRSNWERNDFRGSSGKIKNRDLWEELFEIVDNSGELNFIHVRGHQGFFWNERVDSLARAAADEIREQRQGW